MKLIIFLFILFPILANGQKSIDTIELYNGKIKNKRIEINAKGQTERETIFHNNGKIEIEYFFRDNNKVHWITYDTAGKRVAEWIDPDYKYAPERRIRNIVFISTSVFLAFIVAFCIRVWSYKMTYYSLFSLTIIYIILLFIFESHLHSDESGIIPLSILSSFLILLPIGLLIFSFFNLFKKTGVHLIISLIAIIFTVVLLANFFLLYNISGTGILS